MWNPASREYIRLDNVRSKEGPSLDTMSTMSSDHNVNACAEEARRQARRVTQGDVFGVLCRCLEAPVFFTKETLQGRPQSFHLRFKIEYCTWKSR